MRLRSVLWLLLLPACAAGERPMAADGSAGENSPRDASRPPEPAPDARGPAPPEDAPPRQVGADPPWDAAAGPTPDAASRADVLPDRAPALPDAAPAASSCAAAGVVLCDDFEADAIDPRWTVLQENGGRVRLDATQVAHGRRALHLETTTDGRSLAGIRNRTVLRRLASNRLWGRAFVRFAARTPTNHIDYIRGEGPGAYVAIGAYDDAYSSFYYGPSGDFPSLFLYKGTTKERLVNDRWLCVEWLFDGVDKVVRGYIDGKALEQTVIDRVPGTNAKIQLPTFEALMIGVPRGHEAWVDAVAIGDQRLGCQP